MSPLGFVAATVGAWIVLSALGTAAWSLVVGRIKRRRPTVRAVYPPPPPPSRPADEEAEWIASLPVDCLSDDEVSDLFDDLVRLGGLR